MAGITYDYGAKLNLFYRKIMIQEYNKKNKKEIVRFIPDLNARVFVTLYTLIVSLSQNSKITFLNLDFEIINWATKQESGYEILGSENKNGFWIGSVIKAKIQPEKPDRPNNCLRPI
ncbi:hypothetical protein RSJ42_14155 [Methanosarcina hadiensis]|uniref:hypothetical protein n=1 Tax=Methanosarcina hadiensis TaxID=3078083 RepID=UPI003977A799